MKSNPGLAVCQKTGWSTTATIFDQSRMHVLNTLGLSLCIFADWPPSEFAACNDVVVVDPISSSFLYPSCQNV